MKKKVCKRCKIFVEGNECPICQGQSFSNNFQGRVYIIDPDNSKIAKEIGLKHKGEFAIKVR